MTELAPIPVLDGQLAIPTVVQIPARLETAALQLAAIDGLATASEWARAAIVASFVELPGRGGDHEQNAEVRSALGLRTPDEFAAQGFAGLASANTVRRYAQVWLERFPRPEPMAHVVLPDVVFPTKRDPQVSNNSGENEWYTPPALIEAARAAMGGIDLDPATSEIAQDTVRAATYYTAADDGLTQRWGGNVWMNPPYAQPLVGQFIDKLLEEYTRGRVQSATVLVNNATDTAWGQRLLGASVAVCFLSGRVRFLDPAGNPSGAPLQGQMVVWLEQSGKRDQFDGEFARFGAVL